MAGGKPETLNAQQRALVEENYNLIYFVLKKFNIDQNKFEDYEQVAALALCKAALAFDESKGFKFTTYAVNSMKYSLLTYFRTYEMSMVKLPLKVYQDAITGKGHSIRVDSYDNYSENQNINWEPSFDASQILKNEEEIIDDVYVQEILSTLTPEEEQLFGLLLQGYNQTDIAKIYNCSRANINIRIQAIRQKLKKILDEADDSMEINLNNDNQYI